MDSDEHKNENRDEDSEIHSKIVNNDELVNSGDNLDQTSNADNIEESQLDLELENQDPQDTKNGELDIDNIEKPDQGETSEISDANGDINQDVNQEDNPDVIGDEISVEENIEHLESPAPSIKIALYRNLKLENEKYRFMPGDIITLVVNDTGNWKNTKGLLVDAREQNRYQGISGGTIHRWTTRIPRTSIFGFWKYYITGPIKDSSEMFEDYVEFELVEFIWEPLEIIGKYEFATEEEVLIHWQNIQENSKISHDELDQQTLITQIETTTHPDELKSIEIKVSQLNESINENALSLEYVVHDKKKLLEHEIEVKSHDLELFETYTFDQLKATLKVDEELVSDFRNKETQLLEALNYRKAFLKPYERITRIFKEIEDGVALPLQNLADELAISIEHIRILSYYILQTKRVEGQIEDDIFIKPLEIETIDFTDISDIAKVKLSKAMKFIPESPIKVPINELTGLGPTYSSRLKEHDVEFIDQLLLLDPEDLALYAKVFRKKIDHWMRESIAILNDETHPIHQKYTTIQISSDVILIPSDPPSKLKGVGPKTESKIIEAGYPTILEISEADPAEMAQKTQFKELKVKSWISQARLDMTTDPTVIKEQSKIAQFPVGMNLDETSSVNQIKGIGKKTYEKLTSANCQTIGDLIKIDAETLSDEAGIVVTKIVKWQDQANEILGKPISKKVKSIPKKSKKKIKRKTTKVAANELTLIKGLGPTYAKRLNAANITTIDDLLKADIDDIVTISKANITKVANWKDQANKL